jgi:putative restriction endonuclease
MSDWDRWIKKFRALNVYRAKGGPAPHKPLLLLVILELAEQGLLPCDLLKLSPEITFQFCTYWRIVAHRRTQRPDVRLPFHHLQSDGFWTALGEDHKPSPDDRLTRYAQLDPGFIALASDTAFRDQARRILITSYFQPEERLALYALVGMPVPSDEEVERDLSAAGTEDAQERGRDARFRLNVVAAYSYTCALTGYRLMTLSSGTIVDGAHIHQFARSRNNETQNGLALCKNAHWLFDNGLWTIADDYTIVVASDHFAEDSPDQKGLGEYQGEKIRLPGDTRLWPSAAHLAWHRKHKFQGTG